MSKTLGQIAKHAYQDPLHKGDDEAWEAAAQAVIKRADEDRFQLRLETEHARTAVIEAARAWANAAREEFEWAELHPKVVINPHLKRMFDTIKALEEVEA